MHEAQLHERNCFLTLTYDQAGLPSTGSLAVEHWQLFAKAFRNKLGKFRFFHCGEYGDENGRPHYHAAIFGHDFTADRKAYRLSKAGHQIYTSETLDKLWGRGNCYIGNLTFQSAAYVARYIMKKQLGEAAWKRYGTTIESFEGEAGTWHQRFHFTLKPEYTTMSRKPGIGTKWIEQFHNEVYGQGRDEVLCNGHLVNPPKFYDTWFENYNPAGYRKLKARRRHNTKKHAANNTPDRLIVREKVQLAQIKSLTRDL